MPWKITNCDSPYRINPKNPKVILRNKYEANMVANWRIAKLAGFDTRTILVGCGKCPTCDEEKMSRKKSNWFMRLLYGINAFQDSGCKRWHKGKEKHMEKGTVFFFNALTVSNQDYPGVGHVTNSEITELNKCPAFREYSYQHFKHRLQKLWKRARRAGHEFKYVVFTEFGSRNTCRIHAHIFLFIPGEYKDAIKTALALEDSWRKEHKVEQVKCVHVQQGMMAAIYATKYASKVIQHHRINSSQFDWLNFLDKAYMDEYNIPYEMKDSLTKADYHKKVPVGGFTQWHAVAEGVSVEVIGQLGPPAVSDYLEKLYVLKDEESEEPYVLETFKPQPFFKGGMVKWLRQRPKIGSTLDNLLTGTLKLPPGCSLKMVPLSSQLQQQLMTISPESDRQLIQEAVSGLSNVSVLDPVRLCRVLNQLRKYYQKKSTRYTHLAPSISVAGTW